MKKKEEQTRSLETAEHIMISAEKVPVFSDWEQVSVVQEEFIRRAKEYAVFQYAYIVDKNNLLKGVIPAPYLLHAPAESSLEDVMNREVPHVGRFVDQEEAALMALRNSVDTIAVVDSSSGFLGVIPPSALFQVFHAEHMEDLLKSAGVHSIASRMLRAHAPALIGARLPWLFVGLGGGVMASFIATAFEAPLKEHFILASFIPLVVYMANAIGAQTGTLYMRGLLLGVTSFWAYIKRELLVGMGISLILGSLLFLIVSLLSQNILVGLVLGISLFSTGMVSIPVSLGIIQILQAIGKDPAVGSGPVATIIQDILSLAMYLFIATTLLSFMVS